MADRGQGRSAAVATPPIEEVAAVTQRLAVLLSAGVAPASAWAYLADDASSHVASLSTASRVVTMVAERTVDGANIADAIAEAAASTAATGDNGIAGSRAGFVLPRSRAHGVPVSDAWRGLAAAWLVATESGAPLSACLQQLAESFRALGETQRDFQVALAGPAATARMVMVLPVVGVLFGAGLGFDTLRVLFTTAPGVACLILGALLMFTGSHWNRLMIRAAQPSNMTPGLIVDLMAISMAGGGSLDRSRARVSDAVTVFTVGHSADHTVSNSVSNSVSGTAGETSEWEVVDRVLDLAQRAGVPAADLLRSEARQLRRQARSAGQRAAASLAVKLMLPLGLCVLPAFMLVGVVPLMMAVLSSTVAVF